MADLDQLKQRYAPGHSKHFYGDANKYEKIAEANGIADVNKIQAGQSITIPE